LFFALTVALVVVTSKGWRVPGASASEIRKVTSGGPDGHLLNQLGTVRALVVLTCLAVFAQLGLGAMLRHMPVGAEPSTFATVAQFHVGLALLLVLDVAALSWFAVLCLRRVPLLRNLVFLLALLTTIQLGLGIGTWAVKYSIARWVGDIPWLASYTIEAGSWLQTHIVTGHVAVGSLMLATSVALVLYTLRWVPTAQQSNIPKATGVLEVAL
jgi:cytochrome c oxidase assembly protein subunit 15